MIYEWQWSILIKKDLAKLDLLTKKYLLKNVSIFRLKKRFILFQNVSFFVKTNGSII